MREYTLKIKFSTGLSDWGHLQFGVKNRNIYMIRIEESAPLIRQVGTLLHEFGHMIFYMIFAPEAIDEVREHRFCKKLDDAGVKGFTAYLDGK